ncbi:embryo sac development arrest 7 [Artemisia annua]|uniref:Embryo sac development arrest 7 n=1 Tax=Artemisia annua TaxID=35608 RepID=A0A2U1MN68_ARTAN|nr:embryo sac development arrest 7 [Artemisia annua]
MPCTAKEPGVGYLKTRHTHLMSNYSIMHWSSLSQNLNGILNFSGHVPPTERNTFRRFMVLDADKWDWKASKVPNPLTKGMEESQQAKQGHGYRNDLFKMVADLKPEFIRFPAGGRLECITNMGSEQWMSLMVLIYLEDFEVDENSLEYQVLHPLAALAQQSLMKEHFEPIEEDEDQSVSDAEDDQPSDDEPANGKSKDGKKSRAPRLYEVKDERHAEAFNNCKSLAKEDALPLEERVKALSNSESSNGFNKVKAGPGGSREISFISRSKAKYEADGLE